MPDGAVFEFAVQADDGALAVGLDLVGTTEGFDQFGNERVRHLGCVLHERLEVFHVAPGIRVLQHDGNRTHLDGNVTRGPAFVIDGFDIEQLLADLDEGHGGNSGMN